VSVTFTVALAVNVMGVLGEMDFIENPGVEIVTEIICCVLDDVLYKLRVSVNCFPELTVTVPGRNLEGPSQPTAAPSG
jgi:hypothetical protein